MENSRKRQIAIYCRVGNKDQLGLEAQEEQVKAYVASHPEWELVKVFSDSCPSARLGQRKGLAGLIRGARNQEFSQVVILSGSQLARECQNHHLLLKKLQKEGLTVHYADGTNPDDLDCFLQYILRQGM